MKDMLLSRMKAFAAALASGVVLAVFKALESSSGFDIPTEFEVSIMAVVSGWFVHDIPNKAV